MKNGYAFAGANAYRAEKIETVKQLFGKLKEEFLTKVNEGKQRFL